MSTTDDTNMNLLTASAMSDILDTALKHTMIARFLSDNSELLASLSYNVMSEKMPDISYGELPYVGIWTDGEGITMHTYGKGQRELMRTLRRAIGGKWEKEDHYGSFRLRRELHPVPGMTETRGDLSSDVTIDLIIEGRRDEVCQRVVIGQETRTIPEVEYQPERTVTEDKVEWVCGNLLD